MISKHILSILERKEYVETVGSIPNGLEDSNGCFLLITPLFYRGLS